MKKLVMFTSWFKRNIYYILDVFKAIGIVVLFIMFVNFNVRVANLIQGQREILTAIKNLAEDTKLTSEQKTNILICMNQVPVEERTTDVLNDCRTRAENTSSNMEAPVPKVKAQ